MRNKETCRYPWLFEEDAFSPWSLFVQKDNQKALCSAENSRNGG